MVATNPGFPFQILSHSFGENSVRQNLEWKPGFKARYEVPAPIQ